jgi:transposase-like protein
MDAPNTLQEAIVYFADPDRAFEYAKKLRWPDGKVVCPRCEKAKHSFIKTRRVWFCYECKKQFSLKLGTVFEDSPLGLDKWMTGFWLLVNCKNGVSSMEIHRALGITQKAAWFMLQRLRLAIQDDFFGSKLGGEVEVDESFIGGKARNMHISERKRRITGTGTKDKTAVMGILERGGKQTFRFNTRKDMNDGQRFKLAMSQIGGKRLAYSALTGKNESPRHQATGTREALIPF